MEECPICYEGIEAAGASTTSCGHVFHAACLTSWLERANTCPSCRTVVAPAPTDPHAEPVWMWWFDERQRAMAARCQAMRAELTRIIAALEAVKADLTAEEAARKAKRSEAAKRGAATRAANRRRALVTCNKQ